MGLSVTVPALSVSVTGLSVLISISDSVSHEVSGTEAVTVAPEGLSGDLNVEDLETPFLLM